MYPHLTTLMLFIFVAAFTPGPNNLLSSYSGFNFGIKKSLPLICGVTFGFPILIIIINSGLIIVFKKLPILQEIIKIIGSGFILYFAYKIAFNKNNEEQKTKNPIKFFNMLFFQFINPKAVLFAIIVVSTFINTNESFFRDTTIVVGVALIFSFVSILSWCLLGKFLRRFATNKKFIQTFNYVMSFFLIVCIIMLYI
jgi:threonine/homoserine/homoserine lactone efflux protein|tara:strand:+ start:2363 stop:2953 length:591 start_codon:yes stop_codon:yes gene_type:complete